VDIETMASVKLPLRLRVEASARAAFKHCFVLPTKDEDTLVMIVDDSGLVALATSVSGGLTAADAMRICDLPAEHAPPYLLVAPLPRDGGGGGGGSGAFQWVDLRASSLPLPPVQPRADHPHLSPQCVGKPVARAITEAIHRYYERQVLEPSIRGFLSILEKQFPRNDLYLFELLQVRAAPRLAVRWSVFRQTSLPVPRCLACAM